MVTSVTYCCNVECAPIQNNSFIRGDTDSTLAKSGKMHEICLDACASIVVGVQDRIQSQSRRTTLDSAVNLMKVTLELHKTFEVTYSILSCQRLTFPHSLMASENFVWKRKRTCAITLK